MALGGVALIGRRVAEVALRRPVPGLQAVSELGECCREAVVRGVVGGEFVVSASWVLHERVAGRDRARRSKSFQSAHRAQPCFEPAVISFDDFVRIPLQDMPRLRREFIDDSRIDRRSR
jgi:hypothetical protein